MSLSFRQRYRLRCMRRTLSTSAPGLASMLVMFARLYSGDSLPAYERAGRVPAPVRVLARAAWAVTRVIWAGARRCGRGLLGCGRAVFGWLLRPCRRLLGPCGQCLRRVAVRCLIAFSFLPAGFRLTAGAWLVAHRPGASIPPAAPRRSR